MALKLINDGKTAAGYLALYGSPSEPMTRADGKVFIETIRPGAFRDTLADGHNIMALSNHERAEVLGSTAAGTLRIREDATGLYCEIDLPETQAGNDLRVLIGRGEPYGGSFGANITDWKWTAAGDHCELISLDLREMTITAFPAYAETAQRSLVLRAQRYPAIPAVKNVEEKKEIPVGIGNHKLRLRILDM